MTSGFLTVLLIYSLTILAYFTVSMIYLVGACYVGALTSGFLGLLVRSIEYIGFIVGIIMGMYQVVLRRLYGERRYAWSRKLRMTYGFIGGFFSALLPTLAEQLFFEQYILSNKLLLRDILPIAAFSIFSAIIGAILLLWLIYWEERDAPTT